MIHVVGIGPGSKKYLPPIALEIINKAEVIFGGQRALSLFDELPCEKITIGANIEEILVKIKQRYQKQNVVVLVSGDPGFFSLLNKLREHIADTALNVIPGISSVQLAFARIKRPWHNMRAVSLHGRDFSELEPYLANLPLAILCDKDHPPNLIANFLLKKGVADRQAFIFHDLSCPEEIIISTTLKEMSGYQGNGNVLIILI
jgi:precorrin-6y C5,15-methyltransferase (decarboxylating) CbiE subunit